MKYIRKRDNFLTGLKEYKDLTSINEEAPFENSIRWGDSLLGRLINSAIRKAKVGVNLVRMKSVVNRLKDSMEDILKSSALATLEGDDIIQYNRIMVSSFLDALNKSIEAGDEISIIKTLTTSTIEEIGKFDFEGKDELIKKLEEFFKFLGTVKGEPVKGKDDKISLLDPIYSTMIDNLKFAYEISLVYNNFKKQASVNKPIAKSQVVPIGTTSSTASSTGVTASNVASNVAVNAGYDLSEYDGYSIHESQEYKEFMTSVKPLYTYMTGVAHFTFPDSKTERDAEFYNTIKAETYKRQVIRTYISVRSKSGSLNESVSDLLKSDADLSNHLYTLYQTSKKKEDGSFEGLEPNVVKSVSGFNKTMKEIIEFKPVKKEDENKSERLLTNYSSFVNIILEADDTEVSAPSMSTKSKAILDYWKKYIDLKTYVLDKTEFIKIKNNLEPKIKSNKDSIVIDGMGPILEVVKVFNRAYKLHTTKVIPTDRSGGEVSNKTFMEYTSFGGGSPGSAGSSGGPYRNNAVFNQWEDAVLNVLKDKKYEGIFNTSTKIKSGSEYIDKAGLNLKKFMNDLLDGDELYKGSSSSGGGQGAQAKLLDKYFGYTVKDSGEVFIDPKDEKIVNEVANDIKKIEMGLLDAYKIPLEAKIPESKGTFFALDIKESGVLSRYYFYIHDYSDGLFYLSFCKSSYFLKEYVRDCNGKVKTDLGDGFSIKNKNSNSGEYEIMATTIKADQLYESNGTIKLKGGRKMGITKKERKNSKVDNKSVTLLDPITENVEIIGAFHIVNKSKDKDGKEKNEKVKALTDIDSVISSEGGFTISQIKDPKVKNSIISL